MGHHTGRKSFIHGTKYSEAINWYPQFSIQILYKSGACCHAQPMFEKTVREQKHPMEVDKCRNSLSHNFLLIQNHYCQCPAQGNLCLERAGQLVGHPLPHQLGICHLVWQLINTYMNMDIAGWVPVSQWVPSYPASQVQAYWFTWSTHVAPFIQGSLAHSSVSGKLDLNMHCYSLTLNAIMLLRCNLQID